MFCLRRFRAYACSPKHGGTSGTFTAADDTSRIHSHAMLWKRTREFPATMHEKSLEAVWRRSQRCCCSRAAAALESAPVAAETAAEYALESFELRHPRRLRRRGLRLRGRLERRGVAEAGTLLDAPEGCRATSPLLGRRGRRLDARHLLGRGCRWSALSCACTGSRAAMSSAPSHGGGSVKKICWSDGALWACCRRLCPLHCRKP